MLHMNSRGDKHHVFLDHWISPFRNIRPTILVHKCSRHKCNLHRSSFCKIQSQEGWGKYTLHRPQRHSLAHTSHHHSTHRLDNHLRMCRQSNTYQWDMNLHISRYHNIHCRGMWLHIRSHHSIPPPPYYRQYHLRFHNTFPLQGHSSSDRHSTLSRCCHSILR